MPGLQSDDKQRDCLVGEASHDISTSWISYWLMLNLKLNHQLPGHYGELTSKKKKGKPGPSQPLRIWSNFTAASFSGWPEQHSVRGRKRGSTEHQPGQVVQPTLSLPTSFHSPSSSTLIAFLLSLICILIPFPSGPKLATYKWLHPIK